MESSYASCLPPLLAILLAVCMRRIVVPLLCGVALGAGLLAWDSSADSGLAAVSWEWGAQLCGTLWESVTNLDHLKVLAFTLLLGAMVGVLESTGGLARVIVSMGSRIRSRRGGQWLIGLSGLAIFFDDYANTLLVGGTMRPAADRYGISRAKLAYLVDSTSAPVAGLALVSTWVATEIGYLGDGLLAAGIDDPSLGLSIFVRSLPYRFYPWFALVMLFATIVMNRELGAMHAEEVRAASEAKPHANESGTATTWDWCAAVLPILACLVTLISVLVITGRAAIEGRDDLPLSGSLGWWGSVIGNGKSYDALVLAGGVSWMVAILTGTQAFRGDWNARGAAVFRGSLRGIGQMMPAMVVLWLSWAMASMGGPDGLNTSGYLSTVLGDSIPASWLPSCVFLTAGLIALATGTSWGTMAILTPIVVPLVLHLQPDPNSTVMLATFSSVLAGAIFGDHCSPLSDTTVLSSRACGCDHSLHVRTQMPYAIWVAGVTLFAGTIPCGAGVPVHWCLLVGLVSIICILRFFGKPVIPVKPL